MFGKSLAAGLIIAMTLVMTLQPQAQAGGGGGGGARVRLQARLGGAGTPASGKANFEARGSRMKLSVEVEDFIGAPGVATVDINGSTYALQINAAGFGDLNLDTENGNSVPNLSGGGTIIVTLGAERISGSF